MGGRALYGVLWALTVVAYSTPWARVGGELVTGWGFTIPFSITYVIGMLLGLIVLATKRWAFGLTIVAGILMLLGLVGAAIGYWTAGTLGALIGEEVVMEGGMGLAFLASIVYMVGGAILAARMK